MNDAPQDETPNKNSGAGRFSGGRVRRQKQVNFICVSLASAMTTEQAANALSLQTADIKPARFKLFPDNE